MTNIAAIMGGIAAASGLIETGYGVYRDERNYRQQRSVLDWQQDQAAWHRDITERAMAREDTAVQRRVADLRAAGINPMLAAGSAAGAGSASSPPINVTTPQRRTNPSLRQSIEQASMALNILQQRKEIARTDANTELIRLQQQRQRADIAKTNAETARLRGITPHEITGMTLTNEFHRLANPMRLEQIALDNRARGIDNAGRQIRNELNRLGITHREVQIVGERLRNRLTEFNVTHAERRLIEQQVAINLAKLRLQTEGYNLDYARLNRLPTHTSPDFVQRRMTEMGIGDRSIWNRLFQ